jgi:hypothetical protein
VKKINQAIIVGLCLCGTLVGVSWSQSGRYASKPVYSEESYLSFNVARIPISSDKSRFIRKLLSLDKVKKNYGAGTEAIEQTINATRSYFRISDQKEVAGSFELEKSKRGDMVGIGDFLHVSQQAFLSMGMQARVVKGYQWKNRPETASQTGMFLEIYNPSTDSWMMYDPGQDIYLRYQGKYIGSAELVNLLSGDVSDVEIQSRTDHQPNGYFEWFKKNVEVLRTDVLIRSAQTKEAKLVRKDLILHRLDEEGPTDWFQLPIAERPIATASVQVFNLHS